MSDAKKTIKLQLKVETNGEGKIKALSVDAKDFAEAVRDAAKAAKEVKPKLESWGTGAVMLNNISLAANGLNAVMQQLSAAYQVQEQNETRLAQAMANTMNATQEEVQSVKDLCSAQQQLGVIGDEVLLQGAQELAMHLNNVDALNALIPVMNDVITQQYGIGASGEAAASVGKMLGKVMEGQTAPLKRLGISLSEADKALIEHGTESERAAALSRILEERFGGMAQAAAQTASGKLAQLNNTIGDYKESIGAAVGKLTPFIQIIAQSMQAVTGTITVTKGLIISYKGLSGAAQKAKASIQALNISMKSFITTTGVGLAFVALVTIIEKLSSASKEASESVKALQEAEEAGNAAAADAVVKMREQKKHLQELVSANKDTSQAVAELNSEYGNIMGTYKTAAEWIDTLSQKERAYAKVIAYRGKQQALAAKLAEAEIKRDQLKQERDELKGLSGVKGDGRSYGLMQTTNYGTMEVENSADKEYNRLTKEINDTSSLITEIESEIDNINSLAQSAIDEAKQGVESITFDAATASANELGKEIQRLENKLKSDFSTETINSKAANEIKAQIASLKATKAALDKSISPTAATSKSKSVPEVQVDAHSVEYAEKIVASLQTKLKQLDAYDFVNIEELDRELQHWQQELKSRKVSVGMEIDPVDLREAEAAVKKYLNPEGKSAEIVDNQRQSVNMAQANITALKFDLANGIISPTEAREIIDQINAQLASIGLEPLKVEVNAETKSIDEVKEKTEEAKKASANFFETFNSGWGSMKGIAGGVQSLTEAFDEQKSVWESITQVIDSALSIYQGFAQLIELLNPLIAILTANKQAEAVATTAAGTAATTAATETVAADAAVVASETTKTTANIASAASGTFAAHSSIPWVGIAIAGAMVAAMLATMLSLPKFAEGGIAYGPTLGLFGEYAGAANNPEVVAPLNTLTRLIQPENPGLGKVEFEIDGRVLRGVLKKVDKLSRRS